ncbi:hypothetical protein C7212DRAFT_329129, partial [Tuber magnatum]
MESGLSGGVESVVENFRTDLEILVVWKGGREVVPKAYSNRGFGNSYFFDQF